MGSDDAIPIVDGKALAGAASAEREQADAAVAKACHDWGFMVVANAPGNALFSPDRRARLLSVFDLPGSAKQRLYRQRFASTNPNRYRGLAPMAPGEGICTENLDVGPDAVTPGGRGDPRDVLCERSAWPDEVDLPGWRESVARTYAGFETLGLCVVASIERALSLPEGVLAGSFEGGQSTLRLVRHPAPGEWDTATCERLDVGAEAGRRMMQLVLPHTDSGCVTFVSQDEGGGLQARASDGAWMPVPNEPGWLAVNFGKLLQRWSAGAVRATEHRVIGSARRRMSIPFFYEPRADARIEPVIAGGDFEPFVYGDWVWERMQQFPEYQNLGDRFIEA